VPACGSKQVAASLKAAAVDVVLGLDATETRVKQAALDQYRIVYFATHGLLAGEVAEFTKLNGAGARSHATREADQA
jgi:CHAT domain-containing protein